MRGGPPPGHEWNVEYLSVAQHEALRFLTTAQYRHMVDQLRSLAREKDPTHPCTVRVENIEDFWELKDKGGPLGKINVRVFFFLVNDDRTIVVLGAFKKENDGLTPPATRVLMRARKRKYLNGEYGAAE